MIFALLMRHFVVHTHLKDQLTHHHAQRGRAEPSRAWLCSVPASRSHVNAGQNDTGEDTLDLSNSRRPRARMRSTAVLHLCAYPCYTYGYTVCQRSEMSAEVCVQPPLAAPENGALQIVDLPSVTPTAMAALWRYEVEWWRTHLSWDITDSLAALQRVAARGGVPGKAVQVGSEIVGYAYYSIAGDLGMLSGLVLAPAWDRPDIGTRLLQALLEALRQQGARRIESSCIALTSSWLAPVYVQTGFQTAWRSYMSVQLAEAHPVVPSQTTATLAAWRGEYITAAATIMHAAYQTSVDGAMNRLYHTPTGCRSILDELVIYGSCGPLVPEASALARVRSRDVGFIAVTAVAPRHGHLAQIAVMPTAQGCGVGRQLLAHCVAQLTAQYFDTLSLIVSRDNQRALALYQALGMQENLAFPVFVWEDTRTNY